MNLEETRTFTLDVPATFPITDLQGKQVTYTTTLHGINVKKLPSIDDALAEKIEPGLTLETLKAKIRENHEANFEQKFLTEKRNAIVENLLGKFTCELPDSVVAAETNSLLKEIVAENQARGVSDEDLKSHTAEIFETASKSARDRVRANFLLLRIAKEENIQIAEAELYQALFEMSQRYEIPIKKLATDMSKSGGIGRLREQILISKALDLVASTATVNEPAASAA
jgi:trigger factor